MNAYLDLPYNVARPIVMGQGPKLTGTSLLAIGEQVLVDPSIPLFLANFVSLAFGL